MTADQEAQAFPVNEPVMVTDQVGTAPAADATAALARPVQHMQVALDVLATLRARLGDRADVEGAHVLALAMLALHPDHGSGWFTPDFRR
ncbi:hypothetical protein [Roseospira visakhapatnamensis]|uniref:Uncharacterized protein n=1 Tax=Roseospira visakhapatnamensis TaxID=390880 RepID=A0A7W6RFX9_9PROT|nr:hypothetical protein [Roseospira visakhapatnamensis]MBB4267803.1 hypothetical protein [Roseospira visakhapatnamensis]